MGAMRRTSEAWLFWLALASLGACAAPERGGSVATLGSPARIELVPVAAPMLEGTDARAQVDVMRGQERIARAERAERVGDGVVFVSGATLERAFDDGAHEVIAEDAAGPFAVAPDGASIAVAVQDGGGAGLVLVEGGARRRLASGLGPIGALRFASEGASLAFVGSVNGGVAGLWIADTRVEGSARCLTNCELRTGAPWGSSYVPPPASSEDIDIGAEVIRYRSADGSQREARR